MKIFPDYWANPLARHEVVEAPVGERCAACDRRIEDGDRGVVMPHVGVGFDSVSELPWHRDCLLISLGLK